MMGCCMLAYAHRLLREGFSGDITGRWAAKRRELRRYERHGEHADADKIIVAAAACMSRRRRCNRLAERRFPLPSCDDEAAFRRLSVSAELVISNALDDDLLLAPISGVR